MLSNQRNVFREYEIAKGFWVEDEGGSDSEMYFRYCAFREFFFSEKLVRSNTFRWMDTISFCQTVSYPRTIWKISFTDQDYVCRRKIYAINNNGRSQLTQKKIYRLKTMKKKDQMELHKNKKALIIWLVFWPRHHWMVIEYIYIIMITKKKDLLTCKANLSANDT
jgi:hypothetical protein